MRVLGAIGWGMFMVDHFPIILDSFFFLGGGGGEGWWVVCIKGKAF